MPRFLFAGIVVASLIACGCSHYAEPAMDATRTAELIGRNGAYIYRVDGDDVASAQTVTPENGNRVRVRGGAHDLKVSVVGIHPATWNFRFHFDQGKTYVIEPQTGSAGGLTVTDQTTGRAIPVK